ncbi:MAG: UbiX family flavin prenyltransferase [Zetaproteobacteria bacterium]|nr:MAG: UbiX family flavin prenyltransferase [Zetaproteobacteria bacterium]
MTGKAPRVTVAITGASGAGYALLLLKRLLTRGVTVHLMVSDAARVVLRQEADLDLPDQPEQACRLLRSHLDAAGVGELRLHPLDDWMAPPASGSAGITRMVVVPCSMGTLARIACGTAQTLIERAADVMLKERRRLILVPRETPLSAVHLEQMRNLDRMGVVILPAMPGFYHRPQSIDDLFAFVVDRIMDQLGLPCAEALRWGD